MALSVETLAAAKKYTKDTVAGAGAVKGVPCQIQSKEAITGGNRITFLWEDNDGEDHTTTMDVMNGQDGQDGQDGQNGAPGEDGFSPTIEVKTSTSDSYILTITNEDGSYDTPNLKGSGGGGSFTPDPEDPLDEIYLEDTVTGKVKTVTVTNGKVLAEDYESGGTTEVITITEVDNAGKVLKWKDSSHNEIVEGDSSYVYGDTDYIDLTDVTSVVISAYAVSAANNVTYVLYDANHSFIFVGTPSTNDIPVDATKKFNQDFNIPLVSGAKYIRVNFWKNDAITWTHPVLTITKQTSGTVHEIQTIHFTQTINKYVMDNDSDSLSAQDGQTDYTDTGVLFLPKTYKEDGQKTRLVITCHGSGTVIDNNFVLTTKNYVVALVKSGYAVLDVNGGVSDGRHYGAPFAIQSYVKAYEWAIKNYNLYAEVFVFGASMGGLPSFNLVNSGAIPVKAQGACCPCTDLLAQAWYNPWYSESGDYGVQRERIAQYFNFTNYAQYESGSSQQATTTDMQYFIDNIEKVKGYYPMIDGASDEAVDAILNTDFASMDYSKLEISHNVPLKIWHAQNDTAVNIASSRNLVNAIKKHNKIAYLREFSSGGHTPDLGNTINMKDTDGVNFSSYVAYYELVQWFRRWE